MFTPVPIESPQQDEFLFGLEWSRNEPTHVGFYVVSVLGLKLKYPTVKG
jgi:hypothetical protein